ncbi:MAG: Asp-tRNA(Asn)/Glu-tRNA(Gln) amidotransferase subunit GatB [Myxococcales bacterium]|nr:Asp-tRNA(Asn)/Glu-tRNA(Gln) amidotransferase subunit GatB [Myxococcales bacterium]
MIPAGWEAVIGLEVHVHLKTRSKLFCGCAVGYGDEPNHHVCPVCLALPGALPVLNAVAVELAIRAGLATHCKIHPRSVYARKNYFYPDLPKGYQISQLDEPLATGGYVEITPEGPAGTEPEVRRIGLTRIHMEEDAGKSIHDDALAGPDVTLIDFNRTSVPLVEIVSEPDLRTPEEVGAYLRSLREILRYVGASDVDMEKGQFRCDVNVSVRRSGDTALGTRREMKNVNSFRAAENGARAEIARQIEELEDGGEIQQSTLRYDVESGRLTTMRLKENADDYRYFPDPDLVPVLLDDARIEEIRGSLPELPDARRERVSEQYGLSDYDARLLTASRPLADFFEETVRLHGDAKTVANWISRDVLAALKEEGSELEESALEPPMLAGLLRLVDESRVTARSARELIPDLVREGGDPEAIVRERGLEAVSDSGELEALADAALEENPRAVASFHDGDGKSLNFLMGQVMKKTGGKADARAVRSLLERKLTGGE